MPVSVADREAGCVAVSVADGEAVDVAVAVANGETVHVAVSATDRGKWTLQSQRPMESQRALQS